MQNITRNASRERKGTYQGSLRDQSLAINLGQAAAICSAPSIVPLIRPSVRTPSHFCLLVSWLVSQTAKQLYSCFAVCANCPSLVDSSPSAVVGQRLEQVSVEYRSKSAN